MSMRSNTPPKTPPLGELHSPPVTSPRLADSKVSNTPQDGSLSCFDSIPSRSRAAENIAKARQLPTSPSSNDSTSADSSPATPEAGRLARRHMPVKSCLYESTTSTALPNIAADLNDIILRNTALPLNSSELFNGDVFTKSEDYIINLWAEGDSLIIYPIDVFTYLMLMGRSVASCDHLEGYERMREEIKIGIKRLLEVKAEGKGLFFEPNHQFSEAACRKFPHYPFLYGISKDKLNELIWGRIKFDLTNPHSFECMTLIYSNARVPLPADLVSSPTTWISLIQSTYGECHPIVARCDYWGASDRGLRYAVHYGLAERSWPSECPLQIYAYDGEYESDDGEEKDYEQRDIYSETSDEEPFSDSFL